MAFKQRVVCLCINFSNIAQENINFFVEQAKMMGVGDLYIFVTIDLYEEKNLKKVLDCLFEIQKLFAENQYKEFLKGVKEQASEVIICDENSVSDTITTTVTVTTNFASDIRTMNEDEELRKQLKYVPKLAQACQRWIEG